MKVKEFPDNHNYVSRANEFYPHCLVPISDSAPDSAPAFASDRAVSLVKKFRQPIIEEAAKAGNAQNYVPETPAPAASASSVVAEDSTGASSASADQKTVAVWDAPSGSEPVVGWIVCVKGSYFGQSFTLKTGNNNVGRSMDMDIPLAQENTIARNRHCVITFEPEKQEFYIQPGEGAGLTYLNGEVVMAFMRLNERDTLKLGYCDFVFYPLCTSGFTWKNFI